MRVWQLMSCLLLFVCFGCASVAKVYEGKDHVKGIPFYAKKGVCRQHTIYEKYVYGVTLAKTEVTKYSTDKEQKYLELKYEYPSQTVGKLHWTELRDLKRKIALANGLSDDRGIVDAYINLTPPAENDENEYWQNPVANTIEEVAVVDYSRQYYLNANLPIFGNGSLTGEYNADGTLTKTSANAETKLAEALSSLLPIKEFASAKLIPQAATTETQTLIRQETRIKNPEIMPTQVTYILTIAKNGSIYDFTADYDKNTNKKCTATEKQLEHLPFDTVHGIFTLKPIGEATKDEKDDKNKMKVSGEITLPGK